MYHAIRKGVLPNQKTAGVATFIPDKVDLRIRIIARHKERKLIITKGINLPRENNNSGYMCIC